MTNRNNKLLIAAVGTILILGIMVLPLTMAQNAQAQSRKLTCDTTKDCNIIIRRLRVGDDLIIQFKATPPAGGNGGNTGGGGPAVDQEARDDITDLKSADVQHTSDIATLQSEYSALQNRTSALESENQALKDNLTTTNSQLAINTVAIAELQSAVQNITDANPFVDLNVTGGGEENQTGPGEPQQPPQGNETGETPGGGENQTTTPPIGGNESTPTEPIDNQTAPSPPIGNESNTGGGGNETEVIPPVENPEGNISIPIEGNATVPIEGNVTVPIEGNVSLPADNATIPGESNVTLPIDNATGDVIIGSGNDSGAIANVTGGQDILDFTQ